MRSTTRGPPFSTCTGRKARVAAVKERKHGAGNAGTHGVGTQRLEDVVADTVFTRVEVRWRVLSKQHVTAHYHKHSPHIALYLHTL